MSEANGSATGRRLMPSFRNELSLGNIIALAVMIFGGIGFLLTYEHRMTALETIMAANLPAFQREIDQLDLKIDLSRDVRGIRQNVDDLVGLHRSNPR